jgi:hypothetical protein
MQWTSRGAMLALLILLAAPAAALADGGPVMPVQGAPVRVPGSPGYGAFRAGGGTIIKRLGASDVPTGRQLRVGGQFGVPGVDLSGGTTGLSADRHTLVLAEIPRNGPSMRATRLLIVNTPRLTMRARITLPGWSTVDAISPDGRWLYLIHYLNSIGTKYEVRAYDLPARRMLPDPIVDPTDWGEAMTGIAVTRVMSAGSRWAYTLYLRPSGVPFVHMLDTVGRRAVCIDMPSLKNVDIGDSRLSLTSGGGLLHVEVNAVTRAVINTRTLALVTPVATPSRSAPAPAPAPARPAAHKSAARRSDGVQWALFAGLLAALTALAVGVARRLRPGRESAIRVARVPD